MEQDFQQIWNLMMVLIHFCFFEISYRACFGSIQSYLSFNKFDLLRFLRAYFQALFSYYHSKFMSFLEAPQAISPYFYYFHVLFQLTSLFEGLPYQFLLPEQYFCPDSSPFLKPNYLFSWAKSEPTLCFDYNYFVIGSVP